MRRSREQLCIRFSVEPSRSGAGGSWGNCGTFFSIARWPRGQNVFCRNSGGSEFGGGRRIEERGISGRVHGKESETRDQRTEIRKAEDRNSKCEIRDSTRGRKRIEKRQRTETREQRVENRFEDGRDYGGAKSVEHRLGIREGLGSSGRGRRNSRSLTAVRDNLLRPLTAG